MSNENILIIISLIMPIICMNSITNMQILHLNSFWSNIKNRVLFSNLFQNSFASKGFARKFLQKNLYCKNIKRTIRAAFKRMLLSKLLRNGRHSSLLKIKGKGKRTDTFVKALIIFVEKTLEIVLLGTCLHQHS